MVKSCGGVGVGWVVLKEYETFMYAWISFFFPDQPTRSKTAVDWINHSLLSALTY